MLDLSKIAAIVTLLIDFGDQFRAREAVIAMP
jgi:hypothetical protein